MNLDGNMNPKIPPGSSNSKTHLRVRHDKIKLNRMLERSKFSLYPGPTSGPVIRASRDPVDDVLRLAVFITLEIPVRTQEIQG